MSDQQQGQLYAGGPTGLPAWRAVDRVLAEILRRLSDVEDRLDAIEHRLSTVEGEG